MSPISSPRARSPRAALLTLIWPKDRDAAEIALFAEALGGDLEHFGMSLIGGDTTSTPGPLTVSITAFGEPLGARTPARADAQVGDDVWLVGGEIGSAWLGLQLRTGAMALEDLRRGRDEAAAQAETRAMAGAMPDYLTLPGQAFDAEAAWLMSSVSRAVRARLKCAEIVAQFRAVRRWMFPMGWWRMPAKMAAASGVALQDRGQRHSVFDPGAALGVRQAAISAS